MTNHGANYIVKVWRFDRCRRCGRKDCEVGHPGPHGRWMSVWRGFSLVRARQIASTLESAQAIARVYVR